MGFWQGLGRMIAGQPVYQADDRSRDTSAREEQRDHWQDSILPDENQSRPSDDVAQDVKPQDDQATANDHYTASGEKIIPEVSVGRCETHEHGDDIELWIVIANDSAVEVMVDKITMLGTTAELNRFMKPGEEREFMVYRGDKIKKGNYTKAQIYYRAQMTGDYFCADQQIIYRAQSDGDYQVDELRLIRPIHDV
ncbi:MAG: hypothetical protein WBB39_02740 [Candidatus Saccharimonadales bacterium]